MIRADELYPVGCTKDFDVINLFWAILREITLVKIDAASQISYAEHTIILVKIG